MIAHSMFLTVYSCRLHKQEAARGHVSKDLENQVERMVQSYKTHVGRRVSQYPEKTYANYVLEERGLGFLKEQYGEALRPMERMVSGLTQPLSAAAAFEAQMAATADRVKAMGQGVGAPLAGLQAAATVVASPDAASERPTSVGQEGQQPGTGGALDECPRFDGPNVPGASHDCYLLGSSRKLIITERRNLVINNR